MDDVAAKALHNQLLAKGAHESATVSPVKKNDSAAALSCAEPTRPIDWVTPRGPARGPEALGAVLAPNPVRVKDHPPDVTAPRAGSQLGVVVLIDGEVRHPAASDTTG